MFIMLVFWGILVLKAMKLRSKILGINIVALAFVLATVLYIAAPFVVNSHGRNSLWLFAAAMLGVGAVSVGLSAVLLESMVIRRIGDLTKRVDHIKNYRSYYESLHYVGKDEVATLANAINQMLSRIVSSTNEVGALNAQLQEEKKNIEQLVSNRTEQLRTEQVRLKASLGSLSFGVIMTDTHNDILLINAQARQILHDKQHEEVDDASYSWSLVEIDHRLGESFGLLEKLGRCLRSSEPEEFTDVEYNGRTLRILISPILESKQSAALGCVVVLEEVARQKASTHGHDKTSSAAH